MKQISDFFHSHRAVLIWTAGYIAVMWAILYLMFNFNIFTAHNWVRLCHAHLHGFGGFVFGILILAAAPLYVATTAIVARKNELLFTIPLPWFLRAPASNQSPQPSAADTPTTTTPVAPATPESTLPHNLPNELRTPFLRMRANGTSDKLAAYNHAREKLAADGTPVVSTPTPTTTGAIDTDGGLPLPTDFDFGDMPDTNDSATVPTFTEINFDTPAPQMADTDTAQIDNPIAAALIAAGHKVIVCTADMVITDRVAIAIHDDNDFWIADDENWFATGKHKPSPIAALRAAADAHDVAPILYLAATNIMDLETLRTTWESDGIQVVTELGEIE